MHLGGLASFLHTFPETTVGRVRAEKETLGYLISNLMLLTNH